MSIIVEDLTYTYMKGSPFERTALKNVSLKIGPGEFVGIIGHTGSGKTTLVQHFNGLLKSTSGRVIVNGMDTSSKNLKELRKQVGIVFQYPEHQLFEETVYKDIAFGLQKQGLEGREIENQVNDAMNAVGLSNDILQKSPFELSGGQKRRVAIAGVIAMSPRILVLDEPAAGLDPRGREEIFALISRMHKERGTTIVLVSHSMEDVARLVDRVIVMKNGSIEMDGSTCEVFKNTERLESIGLSAPQVTYLMQRLKRIIPGIKTDIFTLEGAKEEILKYIGGKSHD